MDTQTLRIFKEVAKNGSFLAASKSLSYAQSNISIRMQRLEETLGTTLFYRNNRGISLTNNGQIFLEYAERILSLIDEAEAAMLEGDTACGNLHIGTIESVSYLYLAPLLARYHKENSAVHAQVHTDTSRALMDAVLDRSIDGAFISGEITHSELEAIPVVMEEMCIVTSAVDNDTDDWRDIENKTLLVDKSGCFYRHLLEDLFRENHIAPDHIVALPDNSSIISNLCAGLGMTLMPKALIERLGMSDALKTYDLPAPFNQVQTWFVYRKDHFIDLAFSNFIILLQS